MKTIILKINNDIYDRFIWLLEHFDNHEIEVLDIVVEDSTQDNKQEVKKIEKHWNKIEQVVVKTLTSVAESKLKNDEQLKLLFETAHSLLPLPIRLAIPKKFLVFYCMQKKDKILAKIIEYRDIKLKNN